MRIDNYNSKGYESKGYYCMVAIGGGVRKVETKTGCWIYMVNTCCKDAKGRNWKLYRSDFHSLIQAQDWRNSVVGMLKEGAMITGLKGLHLYY